MHSRKHSSGSHLERKASEEYDDSYEDNNGKEKSFFKIFLLLLSFCFCVFLGSHLFSTLAPPTMVKNADFPDINVHDVAAQAMALKQKLAEGKEDDEKEAKRLEAEEIEEEAKYIREQKQLDEEHALADKHKQEEALKKQLANANINPLSASTDTAMHLSREDLLHQTLQQAKAQIEDLREMKFVKHIVMETDQVAQQRIRDTQSTLRKFLNLKYGMGPYYVKMVLRFSDSMMEASAVGLKGSSFESTARTEAILIELAPIDYVPYSVFMFLENIVKGFKSGAFHRNAGHVLQAMTTVADEHGHNYHQGFAWQEYSPHYPHKKYTLGYAGRPSSNGAFYISTRNNVQNHGPASQGSKSEADSIIGRIFAGEDIVKRMCTQPNRGGNGFIKSKDDYISILSLEFMHGAGVI